MPSPDPHFAKTPHANFVDRYANFSTMYTINRAVDTMYRLQTAAEGSNREKAISYGNPHGISIRKTPGQWIIYYS
ncbi:MAG: hypothetical protein MJA29_11565, partial [Candidatus Omnitrophica bacterium]|nr:hypothetical protein [Candidatus Omnitrophota bacterium]